MTRPNLDVLLVPSLWVFKVVAEARNFARAAERLCVTQSAVSQRIRLLEERLDIKLFERTGREVKLTAAGLGLLNAAKVAFSTLQSGIDDLPRQSGPSILKVRCAPSLALEWLTPRLHDFMHRFPNISVSIFADWTHTDRVQFSRDGIDVAVGYGDPGTQSHHLLVSMPERIRPVCSPAQRLALDAGTSDAAAVVLLHDVTPGVEAAPNVEWMHWQRQRGMIAPHTTELQFNLAWLCYQSACADRGIAIGRSLLVHRLLRDGRLVFANDQTSIEASCYFAIAATVPQPGSPVDLFVQWITAELSSSLEEAYATFTVLPQ